MEFFKLWPTIKERVQGKGEKPTPSGMGYPSHT